MKISSAPLLLLFGVTTVCAQLAEFKQAGRHYFPAGYANGSTSGVPDLFGYGFGALERSFYDSAEQLFYGGSEIGFVTISDFSTYPDGVQPAPFGIPLTDSLTDLKVCGDLLFVTTKDDLNPGKLNVFSKAKRGEDGSLSPPSLIQSIDVGVGPDNVLVSKDCLTVATANEGEGDYDDVGVGLTNPAGSVTILRGPFDNPASPPSVSQVSLNNWNDEQLLEMGVHLPLSLNAMIYYNNSPDIDVNFDDAIANYETENVLEPEYLAWGSDETKIFCNLQENNAVVVIDVASNTATSIHSYGLKSMVPVDVVEDEGCAAMPVVEGLYFLRSADSIASFTRDGKDYIVTANEGDDLEYGEFEEKVKAEDIFKGTNLGFANMTADPAVFDPIDVTKGHSRYFNDECNEANTATPWCSGSMRMSIGSAMIDYSNPEAPNIKALVGIGGRGITIYEVTADGLEQVWDSGDDFEKAGCQAYPWAHNGIQDEEFSPVGGPFYNSLALDDDLRGTIDEMNDPLEDGCVDGGDGNPGACPLGQTVDERSLKDGYAAETVVVGEACGKEYAVTVSEKNSVGFIYDISDVSSPSLVKVFHLSPISGLLNPGLAYDARSLGEIDAESIQFLSEADSPTGKAAVLFSGAWSGTASLWEFVCEEDVRPEPSPAPTPLTTTVQGAGVADDRTSASTTRTLAVASIGASVLALAAASSIL